MSQLKDIKLIILDWDGTLSDSLAHIAICLQSAARELSLPEPNTEQAREWVGLGALDVVQRIYPDLSLTQLQNLVEVYRRIYFAGSKDAVHLFDGAYDTLTALRDRGYQLAVATGKSRKGLDDSLAITKTESFFACTRTADETQNKPDPLMLHQILEETGTDVAHAVMIGDTTYDLDMAAAANMLGIGVSYGAHQVATLQKSNALTIIDQVSALSTLFKS